MARDNVLDSNSKSPSLEELNISSDPANVRAKLSRVLYHRRRFKSAYMGMWSSLHYGMARRQHYNTEAPTQHLDPTWICQLLTIVTLAMLLEQFPPGRSPAERSIVVILSLRHCDSDEYSNDDVERPLNVTIHPFMMLSIRCSTQMSFITHMLLLSVIGDLVRKC